MISSGKDTSWQTGQVFTDLNGMHTIAQHAGKDRDAAIQTAAKQFESLFVNMMMKQMRESNAVFAKDNFLNSQEMQSRQQMLDQQLAIKLSEGRGVGLADIIYRQMAGIKAAATAATGALANGSLPLGSAVQANKGINLGANADEAGIALETQHIKDMTTLDTALRRAAGAAPSVPLHTMPDIEDPVPVSVDAEIIDSLIASGVMDDVPDLDALIARFRLSAENSVRNAEAAKQGGSIAAIGAAEAGTPEAFIQRAYAAAKYVAEKLGVDVQAVLAQSALESGWGDNVANNNLFGIKADARWGGQRGLQPTLEYRNGVLAREQAWFRRYGDWQQSFEDYGNLIQNNPRYQQALDVGSDPHAYARALQRAGYATDPHYARKISDIINSERFQRALSRVALSHTGLSHTDFSHLATDGQQE
jgi:peptidoglycan hydrolase FlgJ